MRVGNYKSRCVSDGVKKREGWRAAKVPMPERGDQILQGEEEMTVDPLGSRYCCPSTDM